MSGLRSLVKRFRKFGRAAMMSVFWSNVNRSLWSVYAWFQDGGLQKSNKSFVNYWLKMMEWLFVFTYIFQVYYLNTHKFCKYFNYTVYFEKHWGLNTSQTENKFLVTFTFSRSYAVLFLVKRLTSETSLCSCLPKHAPSQFPLVYLITWYNKLYPLLVIPRLPLPMLYHNMGHDPWLSGMLWSMISDSQPPPNWQSRENANMELHGR